VVPKTRTKYGPQIGYRQLRCGAEKWYPKWVLFLVLKLGTRSSPFWARRSGRWGKGLASAGCGNRASSTHPLRSPSSLPSLPRPSASRPPLPTLAFRRLYPFPSSFLAPSLGCSLSLPFRRRPPLPWLAVASWFLFCFVWRGTPRNGKDSSVLGPFFGPRKENQKCTQSAQILGKTTRHIIVAKTNSIRQSSLYGFHICTAAAKRPRSGREAMAQANRCGSRSSC